MVKSNIEFENVKKVETLDYIKKKRRWAFFWGFLIAFILSAMIFSFSEMEGHYPSRKPHIARIQIDGGIFEDEYRIEMLDEIQKREDVKALIVDVNSPGGGAYASEEIYNHILSIADHVPVVSVMRDYAASGGYIVSLAGEQIFAGETTVTGSIGVIFETPNITELMDKIGVTTTLVRSSPSKGGVSPLREPTIEELRNEQEMIENMYQWFRNLVAERRGISGNALEIATQGDAFTGDQALKLGLIDEIGGQAEALVYLRTRNAELDKLEVVDWEPLYPLSLSEKYATSMMENAKLGLQQTIFEAKFPKFNAVLQ